MSLDTYTNLKAEVADWINRDDLTSVIPTFITITEAQCNRRLRVRPMITRSEATLSSEYTAVPTDMLEPAQLTLEISESDIRFLQFMDPVRLLNEKVGVTASGEPIAYTIVGGSIQLLPAPDASYTGELVYYAKIPALADNATNWLLDIAPDIYLYGALTAAAPYLADDPRVATWGTLYQTAIADLQQSYRVPSGRLRTELPWLTRKSTGFNINRGW